MRGRGGWGGWGGRGGGGVGAWIRITIADDEVRGRGRGTLGMIIGGWAFVLASFFAYALMNANWH